MLYTVDEHERLSYCNNNFTKFENLLLYSDNQIDEDELEDANCEINDLEDDVMNLEQKLMNEECDHEETKSVLTQSDIDLRKAKEKIKELVDELDELHRQYQNK